MLDTDVPLLWTVGLTRILAYRRILIIILPYYKLCISCEVLEQACGKIDLCSLYNYDQYYYTLHDITDTCGPHVSHMCSRVPHVFQFHTFTDTRGKKFTLETHVRSGMTCGYHTCGYLETCGYRVSLM